MIRFDSVTKVFPNGYVGLEDISFEIEPATLTYVIGESGAGKTTLLRLLVRELDPTVGDIYFANELITDLPSKSIPYLRRKIGVVYQDYKLIPERTVGENIALVLEIMGVSKNEQIERIEEVLDVVGLADKADLFPIQLSGGELQRVSIARALATTPELIFADEPTGNLDPDTSKGIAELLQKITELGTTVIVSTHDLVLLTDFPGRELHLNQGKLVKDSAHKIGNKSKKSQDLSEKLPDENLPDKNSDVSDQKSEKPEKKKKHTKKTDTKEE